MANDLADILKYAAERGIALPPDLLLELASKDASKQIGDIVITPDMLPLFTLKEPGAVPPPKDQGLILGSDGWIKQPGQMMSMRSSGGLKVVEPFIALGMYDAEPARASESNIHGGLLSLADGDPLDSDPTDIDVTKGTGKLIIVINAGSDIAGTITITGTSVDRNTGAATASDTDDIVVDALTTDDSTTDSNGNTVHTYTGAYISSKWFVGEVTLSTTDLTLTDVDVYHCSFEQINDQTKLTLTTFDANIFTTNESAEFDAYLYTLHVTGNKCRIDKEADLHVGADGVEALEDKYWRLRRGDINEALNGSTDGFWVEVHYSNSPAYVEDVTLKVWAKRLFTRNT